MKFEIIDGCPVPHKLAPCIREIKRQTGASLNSCYRGADAEWILRRFGKQSQAQLYYGWTHHIPGFNPANPPGRSTHELRNDGVAFAGWVGMPLRYWQVGMDWTNSTGVVQAARRLGFVATVTYPGNPREGHHVNFRREPRFKAGPKPLKRGSRGARVKHLAFQLSFVRSPHTGEPYLPYAHRSSLFGPEIARAVERFQADHHLKPDGQVGLHTRRQLAVSARHRRRHLKDHR